MRSIVFKAGIVLFAAMIVLAATSFAVQQALHNFLAQPLRLSQPQLIQVTPGLSLYRLLAQWQQQGWIEHRQWARLLLWLQPQWGALKAGTYQLSPEQPLNAALDLLIAGKEYQFAITFVEGSRWQQWQQQLLQATALRPIDESLSVAQLSQQLGIEQLHPEGWFYPDTYHYTAGTPAIAVLKRAYQRMQQTLTELWSQRQTSLLASPYEALILASIIEKETGLASERTLIASVFLNRLQAGMRLQTDPTVIYGLGELFNGDLTRADLRAQTPYNTYRINGLPPTPIAMPGRESLQAALHPAQTPYYYFVSKGDGSHVFAATLAEHNANVRRYILKQES